MIMVKLDKIYTRGGDAGLTSLGDGSRVPKHVLRVGACGTVDEANGMIGLARLHTEDEVDSMLARIQNDLFDLGAEIIHIQEYVQKHPIVDRKRYFTDPNILFAKGVFCKRYSGITGYGIMIFWFFKSLLYGSNFKDCLNLIYGYNAAENILN